MKKRKISLMCTAFRDGFQSAYGARVLSKDYMPIVKQAVDAGITSIEAGGGASFQASFFYNNENAFDVMDTFRKTVGPNVNLQTLSRGVNVVALDSQSSDMIRLHADLFKKHGMTTIRNFDALNDPNNLIYSAQCIKNAGLNHQLCIAMMSLPPHCKGAHTSDFYVEVVKKFLKAKIPFDSLCFKDASGTTTPAVVYDTIKQVKKLVGSKVPMEFHSHETAGTGLACYLSAIDAGIDIVDLSMAPVSGGTCQPDIATLWHALRGMPYELDVDIDAVMKTEENFKEALADYFLPPEALHVEPLIPFSPMPGGALTANTQMLRDNNLLDKYPEIIKAMEECVEKGGFGTSVTPVSQFYFQQAFNNVIYGPWKKIAQGYGKMVLGYFGTTPVAPNKEIVKIASEQLGLEPTKKTVLEINDSDPKKSIQTYVEQLKEAQLPVTDENVFIVGSCGEKGIAFLQGKAKIQVRYKQKESLKTPVQDSILVIEGETFKVHIDGNQATVNGKTYTIEEGHEDTAKALSSSASGPITVKAGTPGLIVKISVEEGASVSEGQTLCTLEVMKMETHVKSPSSGKIQKIHVSQGEQVKAGQILFTIA